MARSLVAEYLRSHKQSIADDWERAVTADLKALTRLERGALLDHLPEVLDALAAFIDGGAEEAERLYQALADGHAMQRLAFGVELSALNIEYGWLRRVLLQRLLSVESTPAVRTDLIRLNEGLDQAIHAAVRRYSERRDHLRDRFIGILGHDLRGPLAAASAAVQLLEGSSALRDADRRALDTLTRAFGRMSRMVNDVLDFARGHLGDGIPTSPSACDMGEICTSAVEEARAAHPSRRIALQLEGNLDGTFDRDRVLQAIGNLVGNAIAHGQDPITLSASETEDRRALITRVSNRGTPIEAPLLNKLFDPFVRAAGSAGRDGLGLGLYIVAEIARAHGATCELSSSASETSFAIRWPRTPRSETPGRP